jgi:hypothetical protein
MNNIRLNPFTGQFDLIEKFDFKNPFRNLCSGRTYPTLQAAMDDVNDDESIYICSGDHSSSDTVITNVNNITIFANGSSGSENTKIGQVTIDNTCIGLEFKEIDFYGLFQPAVIDTGSSDTTFYECRFDKAGSAIVVNITGSPSGAQPIFKSCRINGQLVNAGSSFTKFIECNYCEDIQDLIQSGNSSSFLSRSTVNASINHSGNGILFVEDCTISTLISSANELAPGFPYLSINKARTINQSTGLSEIIEKTGSCAYAFFDFSYKIDGSTINGSDISDKYSESYATRLKGKTKSQLNSLARIAGMQHYANDELRDYSDNGIKLNLIEYKDDEVVETSITETIDVRLINIIKQTTSGIITSLSNVVLGSTVTITNRSGGNNALNLTVQGIVSPTIYDCESFTISYNGTDWDVK